MPAADSGNDHYEPLRCPSCGAHLELTMLEIEEDTGELEQLLLLDCPTGDYQGTLTRQDVAEIIASEVIQRWR